MLVHPLEEKEFALPLSPFLFLSQHVLVFALLFCPPPRHVSQLFLPLSPCFRGPQLPSVPFLLLYMPSPLRPPPPPPPVALSPSIYSLHVRICISRRVKALKFLKRPFNTPQLKVCGAFIAPRPAQCCVYTAIIVLIRHLMLAF